MSENEKCMKNQDFRNLIHIRIIDEVKKCIDYIDKKIKTYGLQDFYVYVVPFTDIDSSRKEILKEVIS